MKRKFAVGVAAGEHLVESGSAALDGGKGGDSAGSGGRR